MRKISLFFTMVAMSTFVLLNSCGKKDDPEPLTPDECAAATFPETTGSATINILNFTQTQGEFTVIDANANSSLAFAVEITKGTNRPQKLRVYSTDCINAKGTIVAFPGQQGIEDNNTRFNLRNTDEAQIRNFTYTVPTGMSTIYLTIETDESNNTFSYKRVKINVSGSGILDSYTGISLAPQANQSLPSRLVSHTGQTYTVCNAVANMGYVDITYGVAANGTAYLMSNPARFATYDGSPLAITAANSNVTCDGASVSATGGIATKFKSTTLNFENVTNAELEALDFEGVTAQHIAVPSTGTVYAFNSDGKKGLIKVVSGSLTNQAGSSISVNVKVQR